MQRLNKILIDSHLLETKTMSLLLSRHAVIRGSWKSKEWYRFLRVYGHSNCNI